MCNHHQDQDHSFLVSRPVSAPRPWSRDHISDGYNDCQYSSSSVCLVDIVGQDPMAVERSNLLDVFKLVIKELLDTSLSFGRMLDDTHAPLQQFFVIMDHIFRHGIKRNTLYINLFISITYS